MYSNIDTREREAERVTLRQAHAELMTKCASVFLLFVTLMCVYCNEKIELNFFVLLGSAGAADCLYRFFIATTEIRIYTFTHMQFNKTAEHFAYT